MLSGYRRRKELGADLERAHALFLDEDKQEAFEFIAGAVERHPDDPDLRLLYATILMMFRPEEVGAEALKARELRPGDPTHLTRVSGPLLFAELIDEARASVTRARDLAPPAFAFEPELKNYEGVLAALDGEDAVAEERFRAAIADEPGNGAFAVDLVRFLTNRHREDEALAVIEAALPRVGDKAGLREQREELTR